jgi:hypothetical protein
MPVASDRKGREPRLSDLIPVPEIADQIGRPRGTVWRWSDVGLVGPDGARVKLRAVRIGAVMVTCRMWLEEFAATTGIET